MGAPAEMAALVADLHDLEHSLREYPAEWPDDLLAAVDKVAAAVKGHAQTERLARAMGAYDNPKEIQQ